jgi:hypothetical protein
MSNDKCQRCGAARTAYDKAVEFDCGSWIKPDGGFIQSEACKLTIVKNLEKENADLRRQALELQIKNEQLNGSARQQLMRYELAFVDLMTKHKQYVAAVEAAIEYVRTTSPEAWGKMCQALAALEVGK